MSAILGAQRPTDLSARRRDVRVGRGRLARRRLGQAVPRLPGRDRRLRARPLPPGRDRRDPRPARPSLAHVQPLLDAADGRARHPPLGSVRRRAGVLRQLGCGGDRGRPQVRAQGHRQDGHRRARRLVPRTYLRGPVDDGSAGEASRVRAARARRPLRPPERRGVAGGRRRRRQRRLRPPRARPGRGRNPPGYARLPRDGGRRSPRATAACSSTTRSSAAWVAPARSSPTSSSGSSPSSSRSRRGSPMGCRSARSS